MSTDDRVEEYGLSLYNDDAEPVLIGEVAFDSSAIQGAPIVFGNKTIVDIPWGQVEFENGFGKSNIKGLHIVLFDKATTSTLQDVTGKWFNYSGYSEFISLAP